MSTQLYLDFPHVQSFHKKDFIVSDCNRLAFDWLFKFPTREKNTCILIGPPKSGKTHLAHIWSEVAKAKLIRTDQDIHEILSTETPPPNCFIDDYPKTLLSEVSLFHLYNKLFLENKNLLICSSQIPAKWNLTLKDLVSRLKGSILLTIQQPDESLLAQLYMKIFSENQLSIHQQAIDYLLKHSDRSFEGAFITSQKIVEACLSQNRAPTIPLVRGILESASLPQK